MADKNKYQNRRQFVKRAGRLIISLPVAYLSVSILRKTSAREFVWQIDPLKCTQCGQCETNCVNTPSAVKCVHSFEMCGYCDLCSGFLRQGVKILDTAAENQLCPTAAITRKFVEEPFFEYTLDEKLCIGCAKCVKGCTAFGNGSLHLQIKHELCNNCNQCSIAIACPSDAIQRVSVANPYKLKAGFQTDS